MAGEESHVDKTLAEIDVLEEQVDMCVYRAIGRLKNLIQRCGPHNRGVILLLNRLHIVMDIFQDNSDDEPVQPRQKEQPGQPEKPGSRRSLRSRRRRQLVYLQC